MSNINTPQGLVPIAYLNGSRWNGQARMYYIASADVNAYAIGDPVVLSGTGDSNGVPGVTLAIAGGANLVLGSIVGAGGLVYGGAGANPNNLNTTVIPATKATAYYVMVADDSQIVFEVQEGGIHVALGAGSVNKNFALLSGVNNGYVSGWLFDNNTSATSATVQLQILGLSQKPGNAFGAYAKWLARINNHSYTPGTVGV